MYLLIPLVKLVHSVNLIFIEIKIGNIPFKIITILLLQIVTSALLQDPLVTAVVNAALASTNIYFSVSYARRLRPLRFFYHFRKASKAYCNLFNQFKGYLLTFVYFIGKYM